MLDGLEETAPNPPTGYQGGWLARLINMVFNSKIPGSDV